jgi:hypothetical protein
MVPPAIDEQVNALAEYFSALEDYPLTMKRPDKRL